MKNLSVREQLLLDDAQKIIESCDDLEDAPGDPDETGHDAYYGLVEIVGPFARRVAEYIKATS